MKQLLCEMCGSNDLIKQDGVYVCQSCGCKYTVEEARKLMVEGTVEVKGTVKVDNSEVHTNNLINAKRAFEDKRYNDAEKLYTDVLKTDPDNAEAVLCQGLAKSWQGTIANNELDVAEKAYRRAIDIIISSNPDSKECADFVNHGLYLFASLTMAWAGTYSDRGTDIVNRAQARLERIHADFKRQSSYLHDRAAFEHARQLALQQLDNVNEETRKETDGYWTKSNQCHSKMLSAVRFTQQKCDGFDETRERIYRYLKAVLDIFNKSILSKKPINGELLKQEYDIVNSSIEAECQKYDQENAAKYWTEPEHETEKKKIDQELLLIDDQIKKLQDERENLSDDSQLKKCDEVIASLNSAISDKKAQLKGMSIFKMKEKKQLEGEIAELVLQNKEAITKKQDVQYMIDNRKNELTNKVNELKKRKEQLNSILLYPNANKNT